MHRWDSTWTWRYSAVAAALIVLACGSSAGAESPTTELREFVARAFDILEQPETRDDPVTARRAIQGLASGLFGAREVAPAALGPHWRSRTAEEREEFVRVFGDLVEAAYLARLEAMLARMPTVRYHGESVSGRRAIVHTVITTKAGGEVAVDYTMTQGAGRWKVRDVVIDGVSLIDNYTAQIARTLKRSSYQELVGQMKARASTPADDSGSARLSPPAPKAVHFDTGEEEISAAAARDLDESIAWLERHPGASIVVEGHADARGAAAANRVLAARRAGSVRDYLVARGTDPGRIRVVGYGTERPLCHEPHEACWAVNRRAMLRVTL